MKLSEKAKDEIEGIVIGTCVIVLIMGMVALFSPKAEAAGYHSSSFKSYSSSRSFSKPKVYTQRKLDVPKPKGTVTAPSRPMVVKKTVINKTTVVQNNSSYRAPQAASSGSSFWSSALGGAAGSGLMYWLLNDDPAQPVPEPQAQPKLEQQQAAPLCDATLYDCTPRK